MEGAQGRGKMESENTFKGVFKTGGAVMAKSLAISGKVVKESEGRDQGLAWSTGDRKDPLRVWREIYQDVRRQWAEAEHGRTGRYAHHR
jgi:hypothetical protein